MGAGVHIARASRPLSAAAAAAILFLAAAPGAQAHRLKLRPLEPGAAESVRLFHPHAVDRVRAHAFRTRAAKKAQAHAAETRFRTQDGYEIPVAVSSAYAPTPTSSRGTSTSSTACVHGSELGKISVYIASPSQIENTFCGAGALACYVGDDERMYVPGVNEHSDPPVQFLIAHEYGHHIELNRSNSPWSAYDQGAKNWATYENVCVLERRNKVRTNYYNDPSEAFAESYADMQFPGVDFIYTDLLKPDQGAFDAINADVTHPWTGPRSLVLRGSLRRPRGASKRSFRVQTPLDGTASFRVSAPRGASYRLRVLSAGGRSSAARSTPPARPTTRSAAPGRSPCRWCACTAADRSRSPPSCPSGPRSRTGPPAPRRPPRRPPRRAPRGPSRAKLTSASTASCSPSNTASTAPSGRLDTQPATPRDAACRRVESRKKTPCTRPLTTTRLRTALTWRPPPLRERRRARGRRARGARVRPTRPGGG